MHPQFKLPGVLTKGEGIWRQPHTHGEMPHEGRVRARCPQTGTGEPRCTGSPEMRGERPDRVSCTAPGAAEPAATLSRTCGSQHREATPCCRSHSLAGLVRGCIPQETFRSLGGHREFSQLETRSLVSLLSVAAARSLAWIGPLADPFRKLIPLSCPQGLITGRVPAGGRLCVQRWAISVALNGCV